MRIHKRETWVPLASTELELAIHRYEAQEDLNPAAIKQRLYLLLAAFASNQRPGKKTPTVMTTKLAKLVYAYQKEHKLTDIEVMQALTSFCQTSLKYDLRWERHKNYDKPAGWQ